MLTVLHGADFHLDAPFAGLSPEKAALRRSEQRALLGRFAAQEADLVLLSGDLFDGQEPYRETVKALCEMLEALRVPVFIAPGNHDYYTARGVYARTAWPGNVHIFTGEEVERFELYSLGCVIYGSAFTSALRDTNPLEGFAAPHDDRLHIMCVHGEVGKGGRYGPIDPDSVAASGLDYLALGHVHSFGGVHRAGDTLWAYAGCPEGRGFDETGDKGALLSQWEKGEDGRFQFIPLCRRRYEVLKLDAHADFAAALPEDAREDIYRIILSGEVTEPFHPAALERLAAERFFSAEVIDRTRLGGEVWARAGENSPVGLFLRALRARGDGALVERAARFGLAALVYGEDPFSLIELNEEELP